MNFDDKDRKLDLFGRKRQISTADLQDAILGLGPVIPIERGSASVWSPWDEQPIQDTPEIKRRARIVSEGSLKKAPKERHRRDKSPVRKDFNSISDENMFAEIEAVLKEAGFKDENALAKIFEIGNKYGHEIDDNKKKAKLDSYIRVQNKVQRRVLKKSLAFVSNRK